MNDLDNVCVRGNNSAGKSEKGGEEKSERNNENICISIYDCGQGSM